MARPGTKSLNKQQPGRAARPVYPFTAIVGQEEMKLALLLNIIDRSIGGVLLMGHRGTGKSTAVRALAALLPPVTKVRDCVYNCDPRVPAELCDDCYARMISTGKLAGERAAVAVVDLPLGATEDRVCGTINIERALKEGVKAFEPGLLARANRGFLYIDEVNLLEDHLVDLLLDVTVTGRNGVEREGISVEHPARFVLIGSGNPEEGELRPQLLDRFGLHVEVGTEADLDRRVEIVERREAFEHNPASYCAGLKTQQEHLSRRLIRARKNVREVKISRDLLRRIAQLCLQLRIDGHRGELTITRAARALAALEGRREATAMDVRRVAAMSLRHRLRRDPLEQTGSGARIGQVVEELFGPETPHDQFKGSKGRRDLPDHEGDPPGKSGGVGGVGGNGSNAKHERTDPIPPPSFDAQLPEGSLNLSPSPQPKPAAARPTSSRRRSGVRRDASNSQSGRYSRAVVKASHNGAKIAVDATLRAAAPFQFERREPSRRAPLRIAAQDLRYKRFKRRIGTLFIFAIDSSGSMALNRIGQAKGALAHLLRQSYLNRDRVSLISFRGQGAEILLPPSQSITRAGRLLDALCIGGSTPLASGLASALAVAHRARRQGVAATVLLLFTDGRANVSLRPDETLTRAARRSVIGQEIIDLGIALQHAGVRIVVVDTQNRFTSNGEGQSLAAKLGGHYLHLPSTAGEGGQVFSRRLKEQCQP